MKDNFQEKAIGALLRQQFCRSAPCRPQCFQTNFYSLVFQSPYINDKKKKAKDWQSKLPRNSSGNYQTACFTDLRVKKRRTEAVKLLSKRLKIKE